MRAIPPMLTFHPDPKTFGVPCVMLSETECVPVRDGVSEIRTSETYMQEGLKNVQYLKYGHEVNIQRNFPGRRFCKSVCVACMHVQDQVFACHAN